MTGRFRASRPGCSSQLTTPIEAGARTPWQSTAAIRVSGSVSHPGQGPGSANRKGCPWRVLSPHLPAWFALLGLLKAGSQLPPSGRLQHASLMCGQLATTLSGRPVFPCFSACRPCLQTLAECICRTLLLPAIPSGQQRAPPQTLRHQGGNRQESTFLDPGSVQSPSSRVYLCEMNVTQDACLPRDLDLTCQQRARG